MDKPLAWCHGEIKSPPFTQTARLGAGLLLRRLQQGENLGMPHSRPMPALGQRCHELHVRDQNKSWRIIYRIDEDAIVVIEVFSKTTQQLPEDIIQTCQNRLRRYDREK